MRKKGDKNMRRSKKLSCNRIINKRKLMKRPKRQANSLK